MTRRRKVVCALAAAGPGICAFLGTLTLFWREWIEFVFGDDLDHRNDLLERVIVGSLFVTALGFSAPARAEWCAGLESVKMDQ
jgi:hypothetical protein